MNWANWGLLVVDLQRYYIDPQANFVRYFESVNPGASDYVSQRCHQMVVPKLTRVLERTRGLGRPVIYLRLCGQKEDRSDLHRHFRKSYQEALAAGFADLYPLIHEPLAEVLPEVGPQESDRVINKTTYSGFTSSDLEEQLRALQLDTVVMTGLATSQCVETTARDASDRGFRVVHLEDCQADYHDICHRTSLFASRSVCGGHVYSAREFLQSL
jgi:nicotinamidase-related amidase